MTTPQGRRRGGVFTGAAKKYGIRTKREREKSKFKKIHQVTPKCKKGRCSGRAWSVKSGKGGNLRRQKVILETFQSRWPQEKKKTDGLRQPGTSETTGVFKVWEVSETATGSGLGRHG